MHLLAARRGRKFFFFFFIWRTNWWLEGIFSYRHTYIVLIRSWIIRSKQISRLPHIHITKKNLHHIHCFLVDFLSARYIFDWRMASALWAQSTDIIFTVRKATNNKNWLSDLFAFYFPPFAHSVSSPSSSLAAHVRHLYLIYRCHPFIVKFLAESLHIPSVWRTCWKNKMSVPTIFSTGL